MHEPQFVRHTLHSTATGAGQDFFVYLPANYASRVYPVLVFLHGNGERGNGKDDLDYLLVHGPLYEAWMRVYGGWDVYQWMLDHKK